MMREMVPRGEVVFQREEVVYQSSIDGHCMGGARNRVHASCFT